VNSSCENEHEDCKPVRRLVKETSKENLWVVDDQGDSQW